MNNNWLTIEQEGQRVILKKCSEEAEGKVIIPDGVTEIADNAFYQCEKVNEVHIPDGVVTIGKCAFSYTNLTSLHLPASIRNIEAPVYQSLYKESPFEWNLHMLSITVDKNNPVYDSREDCNAIIETSSNRLILGCINTFIPDSVSIIGNGSFYGLEGTLKIPKGVKEIEPFAFFYCPFSYVFISNRDTKIKTSSFSGSTRVQRGSKILKEQNQNDYKADYRGLFNIEFRPDLIRKYYSTLFVSQLRGYFCDNEDKGTYIVINDVDDHFNHRLADEMPGSNINENLMFASSLLYMIIAQQSIETIAPEAKEDFHRCTGWPQICSDSNIIKRSHPLEILKNAKLYPMKYESVIFHEFAKKVFGFLRQEINTLLNEKTFPMKDVAAGKHFVEKIDGHKRSNIKKYLNRQEKSILEFFEKWATSPQQTWDDMLKDEGINK